LKSVGGDVAVPLVYRVLSRGMAGVDDRPA
jgi:hypothetical protein